MTTDSIVETQNDRLQGARQFAIEAAKLAAGSRCHNVVVLDVAGLSPVTDFFVIGTGSSGRQMRSVMDDLQELAVAHGYKAFTQSGYDGESWLLCDMVDVIVHLFNADTRDYYDLDNLWGDAKSVAWKPRDEAAKNNPA